MQQLCNYMRYVLYIFINILQILETYKKLVWLVKHLELLFILCVVLLSKCRPNRIFKICMLNELF